MTDARPKRSATRKNRPWSDAVTRDGKALDLDPKVFNLGSPRAIAASPYRSAMSQRRKPPSGCHLRMPSQPTRQAPGEPGRARS